MPGTFNISADMSGVEDAMGYIAGTIETIQTPYYASTVAELTHAIAAREFNAEMNAVAKSQPKKFHHVYEWGKANIGRPGAQLWRHELIGHGNSGMRVATFNFMNSVTPVPRPTSGTAGSGINRDKRYIFAAKAAVMEAGTPVVIRSRVPGGMIFIPNSEYADDGQDFIFTKEAIVKNPGGNVAGNFTTFWESWWNGPGQAVFAEQVAPRLEKRLREIMSPRSHKATTTVRRGKVGTRKVSLSAISFREGMAAMKLDAERMRRLATITERKVNRGF